MLVTFLSVTSCGEDKKETLPAQEIELVSIREVEEEEGEVPPPPPAFDLKVFNIFVLDQETVYYYYDPSFQPEKEFAEYRFENVKEEHLHKSSFKDLKTVLRQLVRNDALREKRVILAVKNNDTALINLVSREILKPLGLQETGVGFINEEVESLLAK